MKKYLLLLIMAMLMFGFSSNSKAQLLFEENFSYTAGSLITANGWVQTGTVVTNPILVSAGGLSYPGYLSSGTGNAIDLVTSGQDVNNTFAIQNSGTVYAGFLVSISSAQTTGDYFFHLIESPISGNVFKGRVFVKKESSTSNIAFGISKSLTTAGNVAYTGFTYALNTTYLIVLKYQFNAGNTTDDNVSIFINPVIGATEPVTPTLTYIDNTQTDALNVNLIGIRQGSSSNAAAMKIDGIRIGLTWSDVTASSVIYAPTIQTSNFTFSAVLQNQMDVSWTSGNGTRRVVKMNTSNSFSDPGNGVDSLGNSIYAGGQQIIYNGSGNTVPVVTGLTLGTTYWFKAWELNGTGVNTMYCTGTGTNNPASQVTAGAAVPPVINNPTATTIKATSAVLGGHIAADGGAPILERGTVWRITPGVSMADNKGIAIGVDSGIFTMLRTSLPPNTTIYYAAYATNIEGTSLSSEASFTTLLGEPTNHAASFTATAPSYQSVVNTWSDNDGAQPATGFLILANTTGVFTLPIDTVPPTNDFNLSDSSGVQTIAHGTQSCTWNSLISSTHYYFAIFAYTNSGNNIDYKTVPAAPIADVSTSVFIPPVAAWTFDSTYAAPATPSSVAANFGNQAASAMLYADGTNGSSSWITATTGNEVTMFVGSTLNDPREGTAVFAGGSYCPVGGSNLSSNGKCMIIKYSMSALENPVLTYATRGTANGFTTQQWAWSTNGTSFNDFGAITNITTSFVTKTFDMSSIDALDGAPAVYLRITFTGATASSGNNRLENIVIRASAASTLPPTVATTAATAVAATSATLNGTVNANNQSTAVTFEYGIAPSTYGAPIAGVPPTVDGGTTTAITADLTGLAQNTTYYYRINGTNVNGPSNGNELTFTTGCLFPEPAGAISGPVAVCANNTGYQYSVPAIPNATSYVWVFPDGTEIMNQGSDTVTAFFGITSGEISVIGTNDCGDEGEPSYFSVTVTLPVEVSVSIAASANNVTSGTTVTFTATPTNGGATPAYQWQVNNLDVPGATNVTYSYIPLNNDIVTCVLTSSESCAVFSPATSNQITMIVTGTPANLAVTGTVSAGPAVCYGAENTITVAGGNTTFEVLAGGSVTMVAGQKILYLPGTKVYSGGYMLGYIDQDGPFCPPVKSSEVLAGKEENGLSMMDNTFKIYPNPTSGIFTIEQLGETITSQVQVEVMGALGAKVLSAALQGSRKQELSIKGNPPGIYFVKVMAGEKVQIVKIILTN